MMLVYKASKDTQKDKENYMTKDIALKDFISNSITAIYHGIREAKGNIAQYSGDNEPIAPTSIIFKDGTTTSHIEKSSIDFDVVVSIASESSKNVKGGLQVNILSLGADKKQSNSNENVQRIKFSVPYVPEAIVRNKI